MRTHSQRHLRRYIESLARSTPDAHVPIELDLLLDVGGLACIRTQGVLLYVGELVRAGRTRVARVSAASAGAWLGLAFILRQELSLSKHQFMDTVAPYLERECSVRSLERHVRSVVIDRVRAEHLCLLNGRLFISYKDVVSGQTVVISEYPTVAHLVEALERSSHIPYWSNGDMLRDGRFCDGLAPVPFQDNSRPALLVSPLTLSRWLTMLISPKGLGLCPNILSGVADAHMFFTTGSGGSCSYLRPGVSFMRIYLCAREVACLLFIAVCARLEKLTRAIPSSIKKWALSQWLRGLLCGSDNRAIVQVSAASHGKLGSDNKGRLG